METLAISVGYRSPTTVLRSQDLPRHRRWARNRGQRCRSGPENYFWSASAEQISGDARFDVLGHSCARNILLQGNEKSCEICTGRCPVAAAFHKCRAGESDEFYPPPIRTFGPRA